ncbi:hypothetical protein [Lyngbya confervoides]|uniref:Uncharacterized protein n=1 Tax=Lyngbya confervoides BDU141951 TaxID=1574623 RepID=A0ABD4SY88_9CYAN|nr:hypothetical protein [Lyngbya confervoides]MCM1981268.1 hypothetical protein [Lyngbya confervoides BDU141951]
MSIQVESSRAQAAVTHPQDQPDDRQVTAAKLPYSSHQRAAYLSLESQIDHLLAQIRTETQSL